MASLRRLVYIFIPVLAVLLMSHNTFAIRQMDPVTCYALADNTITCQSYPLTTGNEINIISIARSNNPSFDDQYGYNRPFLWALRVQSTSSLYINLANGYPSMADIYNVETDCNTVNGNNICNVYITGYIHNIYQFNIQMAGRVSASGASYTIHSVYFSTQEDMYGVGKILDYLKNHPSASAQDIADAVNNDQETATQNSANDSQSAGSSSSQDATAATSSLISTIGGFVSAVTAASPTNCVINGNMGHLNMGNLDLCANPVPSYIQIIGSIILICAVIPLAIILFNRFIGLFRSFQG